MIKTIWLKLLTPLASIVLRYIIPVAIIYGLYRIYSEDAAMIGAGVYLAYLILRLILWPKRYRIRRAREKAVDEHTERLKTMIYAYQYCAPPVISISTLRRYLDKAIEAGAIFEGALFSIIDRVEKTRGEAFLPFAKPTASGEK